MTCLHIDLDAAMPHTALSGFEYLDATEWGPQLRYCAPARLIEKFYKQVQPSLSQFILYGSGDFHHLTALWLRRINKPFTLISFDNHPDWDVRPPRWCCGTWLNRALELPLLDKIEVWGCGSFECWWPTRMFANYTALRSGRLATHAWADERKPGEQNHSQSMRRTTWRERFTAFSSSLHGANIYVTVDLDCLNGSESVTNWEQGYFSAEDLVWALRQLRTNASLIGGDMCGAYSPPSYARWLQRMLAKMDHPNLTGRDPLEAQTKNLAAFAKIWPALTGRHENNSQADEQHAHGQL